MRHRVGYHQDEEDSRDIAAETPLVEETREEDVVEREIVEHEGWHDLLWSFVVSGFLSVSFVYHLSRKNDKILFSCLPTFSLLFLQSLCSVIIWHESGYGILPQVCHMLAKVCYSSSNIIFA